MNFKADIQEMHKIEALCMFDEFTNFSILVSARTLQRSHWLLLPVTRAFGGRGSKLFIARKNPRDQVLKFSQWFTDWIILLCANFKGFTIIGSAIYLMKRAFFLLKLHFFNGFRWLAKKSHWLSTHSVNGIMYTHMSSNS